MNRAFPDGRLAVAKWGPLVEQMTNHAKDRHVLATAVAARATHLVTENTRHFPLRSRPRGFTVQKADSFLLDQLTDDPTLVVNGVTSMAARRSRCADSGPRPGIPLANFLGNN